MTILYLFEAETYSEKFVTAEMDKLESEGAQCKKIFFSDLKKTRFAKKNMKVFFRASFWNSCFEILTASLLNIYTLRANCYTIYLFALNFSLIEDITEDVSHIRSHFLAKRSTFAYLCKTILGISYSCVGHASDINYWDKSNEIKIRHAIFVDCISNYGKGMLAAYTNFKYMNKINLIRNSFYHKYIPISEMENIFESCSSLKFLIVSRLEKSKGIHKSINLVQNLNSFYNYNVSLFIIGDGSERANLELMSNEIDYIHFLGVRNKDEILTAMSKADFLIHLSEEFKVGRQSVDGLPTVFFEALSLGLPIITTEVSGNPEFVFNNFNGIIFNYQRWSS